MKQLFIGLFAEGSTDYRFLNPIVKETFREILYAETDYAVDVEVSNLEAKPSGTFPEKVNGAFEQAVETCGAVCLVVHTDADNKQNKDTYQNKIIPAFEYLKNQDAEWGKSAVALVPVYETEAWMLADKELFKKRINTTKPDAELGIDGKPESIARPKETIEKAIRLGRAQLPKKIRGSVTISDLYDSLGNAIQPQKLEALDSYQDFKNNIRTALRHLGYLH
jgi:hypothetical protein